MEPVVFVDTRQRLPREAVATIRCASEQNATWVIKPADPHQDAKLGRDVRVVDPMEIAGARQFASEFRHRYRHMSTNSVAYERGCFERFLFVYCWAEEVGVDKLWHFDTDALPTIDITTLGMGASNWEVVAGMPGGLAGDLPSVTVSQAFLTRPVLAHFADFLVNHFFVVQEFQLEAWYQSRVQSGLTGGVSDMTAWGQFLRLHPEIHILNAYQTLVGGHLLIDTTYQLREQLQALVQGIPAGWHLDDLEVSRFTVSESGIDGGIPVAGIHMAGADKSLVYPISRGRSIHYLGKRHRVARTQYRVRRRVTAAIGKSRRNSETE